MSIPSFFDRVGAAMTVQYKPVSTEEEGKAALTNPSTYRFEAADDEASVGLLETELTIPETKRKRVRCCGTRCLVFWKVIGIVVAALILWNAFKLLRWALADSSNGFKLVPAFNSSLGCLAAPFIYNQSSVVFFAPMSPGQEHAFDIRGSAAGTFTVAQGVPGSDDIVYEMTLRTNDEALLENVHIRYPDDTVGNSRLMITTPLFNSSSSTCMRFDIKIYVPPRLKKLSIASHTTMHLQFDQKADVVLDDFYVTMFSMNKNTMILPNMRIRAKKMALEVFRGWIVGDVAVLDTTTITTQRGDGVTDVRVHPMEAVDPESSSPASFRTTTGAGRTDVSYIRPKAFKRPIHNIHMSSRNADVYLIYSEAEFNGRIELASNRYSATGLESFPKSTNRADGVNDFKWTHWRGDKDGGDEIFVKSRGWTGLYF